MQAQIVVTLDGQVSIVTRGGSFAEGKAAIEKLLGALQAQGVDVQLTRPVEQHRHDDPGQVRQHVHST